MTVNSYRYLINPDIDVNGYMTPQYIKLLRGYLQGIELTGKTAVLYVGGALLSPSEARNTDGSKDLRRDAQNSTMAVKELAAYSMHKWISLLCNNGRVEYANINGNTCASSLYSMYEAERLLDNGFDDVVIIAEEKTSYNTLRVFEESMIDLKVGEGVAVMHLTKGGDDIHSCKWAYEYNRNPFGVTESGYNKVWQKCDAVKPHGTGTDNNESAEQLVISDVRQVRYKEEIGHCQGASGLLEICMLLDDDSVSGSVLCMAAGMGGFYGSCIVEK